MKDLQNTVRQSGIAENLLDLLGARWRLWRWLDDDGITSKQRRNKRVDEGQIRVLQGLVGTLLRGRCSSPRTFHGNRINTGPTGTFLM
jgi:hypothetical protein